MKQGSSDEAHEENRVLSELSDSVVHKTLQLYQEMLEQGVCAEQARMILPQNTMTEWIWSGTLFAFAKMCKLRLDGHTQKETREIAEMVDREASKLFPVSWKALMEHYED